MNDLRQRYNECLEKYRRAVSWIDDDARTPAEVNKWIGKYLVICEELKRLARVLRPTEEEALNGYREGDSKINGIAS